MVSQPGQCDPVTAANHSAGPGPVGPCACPALSLPLGDAVCLPRGIRPDPQALAGGKGFEVAQGLQPHGLQIPAAHALAV